MSKRDQLNAEITRRVAAEAKAKHADQVLERFAAMPDAAPAPAPAAPPPAPPPPAAPAPPAPMTKREQLAALKASDTHPYLIANWIHLHAAELGAEADAVRRATR
jgi:hypothetical protein